MAVAATDIFFSLEGVGLEILGKVCNFEYR